MARHGEKNDEQAKEIGGRIRQARKEAGGMTQRELGDLLGVTERSVNAYEAGEVVPYRFVRDLELVLNVPAAWILHGDGALEETRKLDEMLEMLRDLKAAVARLERST